MAHLSIESSNPNFSYIINKNPINPAIAKLIRQGTAIGWFPNTQKYCVRFVDPPQEMSYNKAEFEYLDVTALSSPAAYSNLIREFFSGLLKKESELDILKTEFHQVTLGFIKCNSRNLQHFIKFFSEVSYVELAKNTYQVVFRNKEPDSLRKLLHLANLFCIFMMVADEDFYVDITEDVVNKYLTSIKEVKCPYYIANLFKVQFLKTKALFNKFAPILQEACTEDVTFEFGTVLDARKKWIESNLTIKNNIVDIGAGEDFNYAYLSRNLSGIYYPVDRDESARKSITRKTEYKKFDKVAEPVSDWSEVKDLLDSPTEVILTEVLEHNTLKEAKVLLKDVLNHPYVKRILITVPWMPFNQYYLLDTEFRHDDHKWEGNGFTLHTLLEGLPHAQLENIGDQIESIYFTGSPEGKTLDSPTVGIIIKKV
jgi:hypothetical protein